MPTRATALLLACLSACTTEPPDLDGGSRADASAECRTDDDCAGAFCEGVRRCVEGACITVEPACDPGLTCDEPSRSCVPDCAEPDADGDGVDSIACGGTDCDDTNPNRFPGALEVCDVDHLDEDCDPTTFGFRDADGDSYPDAACCNALPSEAMHCGTDCDDTRAAVNPSAAEICDGLDNDCDPATFALGEDDDGDGFADAVCGGTDCDDECPTCGPDGTELCDGRDQDCDGRVDEGVDPTLFETFYRDADGDGLGDATMTVMACVPPPGHASASGDCNDGSALVGACSAPLACVSGTVCGCRAMLFNNAQWLDLDTGTTSMTSAPSGGRDVIVNQQLHGNMYLMGGTGTRWRRYDPADFLAVDDSWATGVNASGEDALPWTASVVYVVTTGSGTYKLGLFESGGGVRFVYAPLGAPPSGFACMM